MLAEVIIVHGDISQVSSLSIASHVVVAIVIGVYVQFIWSEFRPFFIMVMLQMSFTIVTSNCYMVNVLLKP